LKTAKFASDVSECVHEFDAANADSDGCLTSPEMQADAVKSGQKNGGNDNKFLMVLKFLMPHNEKSDG
jgi:hypothetical protein